MVKSLSQNDQQIISDAIKNAERITSAHIHVAAVSASDTYRDFVMLYGLLLGTVAALGLWQSSVSADYPQLLAIQFGVCILIDLVIPLRWLLRFVPRKIRYRRAARRALEEYHSVAHHLPNDALLVLLFISLAERYVHIFTSPAVKAELPDEHWQPVAGRFTISVRKDGLGTTCARSVAHMAEVLAARFPAT